MRIRLCASMNKLTTDRALAKPRTGIRKQSSVARLRVDAFTLAADTVQPGVQPKREQHARVDRGALCVTAIRLDRLDQLAQVLARDVAPHQPGPVVLWQQRFEV